MRKFISRQVSASIKGAALSAMMSLSALSAGAQVTETFTSGTTSWTVPAGVTYITVECWGGGGGGGAATSNASANPGNQFTSAGGGGKGGMYASTTISVTSGTVYSVVAGAGGAAGNASAGGAGGKSALTLGGSDLIWASGGNGGGYGNNSNGAGATGYASAAPGGGGIIVFDGGNGAGGQKSTTRQSGGGGGGGAGSNGGGTAATNPISGGGSPTGVSTGGAGGATSGGAGGAGGSGTTANATNAGSAGATYGGAGGGARSTTSTSGNRSAAGGAGASGLVKITYTVNICTANAGAALAYICENGTSAALGGSVGGLSTTGTWSDGGVNGTFNPSVTDLNATWTAPAGYTGTVTLTLTTTNGTCATAATASKTLAVANAPATPVFSSGATVLCEGATSTYTATASGVSATVTYAIFSGGASIDASTGAVSNVTSDFVVRATATNNCGSAYADQPVTVHANPAVPTIAAGGPTAFCQGGNVTLTSSQSSGNTWSNTETAAAITASQAGSYTVTYTDANGCSATSAPTVVTVHANPAPSITASGATIFCEGGNVTLTSSQSTGNTWSNTETTASITVSQGGSYSVTVTDNNGCSGTSPAITVNVNDNPEPVITANGPTTFCEGGSVTISSSEASGNLWSTGETTGTITVESGQAITVIVTDANGCTGTSNTITTTETSAFTPVITASGPTTFCQGGSVTITSSETSGNVWSTGATGNSITVTQTSNITLTSTASCATGASNAIAVTVHANPATPTIAASGPATFCQGGNVTLTSSASSGNVWSNSATSNAITVSQSGSYSVTVTDNNGCSATSAIQAVTVNPVPVAAASLTGAITITATPAGQSYQWISCPGNQPVNGATAATFNATANGSYAVIVTNASGCKDTSACVQVTKVGLTELESASGISFFPNPSDGMITIGGETDMLADIVVYDASGKVLVQKRAETGQQIDLSAFNAGIYLIKVLSPSGTSLHRITLR